MDGTVTLFSLVAAHTDLDLETVAQLSTGTDEVVASIPTSAATRGAVLLSTCNRLEIYAESGDDVDAAAEEIISSVARGSGVDPEQVASAFRVQSTDPTVRHLFRVGAGLDSAVVGEREVAGQVRRALGASREAGIATGTLTKLFETATRTAKDVGAQTALGSAGRSIVSVALELATDLRARTDHAGGFWEDANVLLIGTGAYAGTALAQLHALGARNVAVHSASGRAEEFVADRGGWAMALGGDAVSGAFAEADVLIGCSGSGQVVSAEQLTGLRENAHQQLTVLDLALSHDFDPAIADLHGVDLITLESVKMAAPDEQSATVDQAQQLVETAVENFTAERKARSANDAIVALRKHTHEVLEDEIERIRARHGCTAASEEVELAMRRMIRQLLHEPTQRARQLAAEDRLEDYESALQTLFGLDVGDRSPTAETSCPVQADRSAS